MAKTYPLKALWPLLPFEVAPAPLQATLDAYGGGLVKYAVSQDGIWLFSLAQPLTAVESENLTGFHPADLVPKQIDGVVGYFYALLGGAPLLPFPFTKDQLIAFNERTAGLIASCIERGSETEAWIADLEKENPDAAELARGIHGGKWPVDLADFLDAKIDDVAKPRFRLADGIEVNASAKALKSAFDEAQHQKDLLKQLGITPDLMKQIDYQKDMEKMLGINLGSAANAVYQQEQKRNQDMLRSAIGPSASETAAETIGRQFASTLGLNTVDSAYLQSQSTLQKQIEKATGMGMSGVGNAMHQHERESLEALQRLINPTARDIVEKLEREGIERSIADANRRKTEIEIPHIPMFDHQAADNRRRERDRRETIETARLAELARLKARDEYEANKKNKAAAVKAVPTKRQTWRDVAMAYMVGVHKAGQYATTKDFYKALLGKAGADCSPFQKGTGVNAGSLFVQAIGKPLSLKALENAMPEIRQAAK